MRRDQISRLSGLFQSFNLSPKGVPEGFVCLHAGETFQVNFPPELAGEIARRVVVGQQVELDAVAFHDAEPDAHRVYELRKLAGDDPLIVDGAGEDDVRVSGVVIRLNHAKRGEVNGAILDTGDFVHLRPHGAREVGITVGQPLAAEGEVRPGWAGCRVIEARTANGISLQKPKPHPHPHKPHKPAHRRHDDDHPHKPHDKQHTRA